MRRLIIIITVLCLVLLSGCYSSDSLDVIQNSAIPIEISDYENNNLKNDEYLENETYKPLNYDFQKSVWLSYIDLYNLMSESEKGFRENIAFAFDKISDLGCNTIYVHVRAFADAYYISTHYAPAEVIMGENGTIKFDALRIMIEEAHKRNLSVHAWINPMRCGYEDNILRMEGTEIYKWFTNCIEYDEYICCDKNGIYWLNPAKKEVRNLISNGVREIAEGYDIDGIHMDDYFYPSPDQEYDNNSYLAARVDLSLSDWRLSNCSEMVSEIYKSVKDVDNNILVGISPQGNINNNYDFMYADVRKWCCEDGYVDYIVPQIYFGYDNPVCPFSETLQNWEDIIESDKVRLVCGLGFYKLASGDELSDDSGIICAQMEDIIEDENCSGFALYSYDSIFCREGEAFENERNEIKNLLMMNIV